MSVSVDKLLGMNPAELPSISTVGGEKTSATPSFQNYFQQALQEVESANAAVKQDGIELSLGNLDNIAQAQIDILKAETLTQVAVQVTTRAVNAYKEIMQMQV